MKHTLKIKNKDVDLTTDEARKLYDQLREVFVTPERVVYIEKPIFVPQHNWYPPVIINTPPSPPFYNPPFTITCSATPPPLNSIT